MTRPKVFEAFEKEISKNGFPVDIVWLDISRMHFSGGVLYINPTSGVPVQKQVETVFKKYEKQFDEGAALMLVAVAGGQSFCTLLMDSFGADDEGQRIDQNIYIYAKEPYIKQVVFVTSKLKWYLITKIKPCQPSSLDYAFSVKQACI